ncbi:hypothetical protein IJ00_08195 [Calothrix sp. 336/3]|nr:hypothetical protein IJ00_08195 [Calothrix sp. 336/3]
MPTGCYLCVVWGFFLFALRYSYPACFGQPESDRWCFLGYLRLQTLLYPGTTKYSLLLPGLKVKIVPG